MTVPVLVPIRTYVLSMAIILRIITPSSSAVPCREGGKIHHCKFQSKVCFKFLIVCTCGVALSCERFIIDSCSVNVYVCECAWSVMMVRVKRGGRESTVCNIIN